MHRHFCRRLQERCFLLMASDLRPEYLATLRRMTGEQKWRTAFGLYGSARNLKAAAVRDQHPEWTEAQVQQRVKEIFMVRSPEPFLLFTRRGSHFGKCGA